MLIFRLRAMSVFIAIFLLGPLASCSRTKQKVEGRQNATNNLLGIANGDVPIGTLKDDNAETLPVAKGGGGATTNGRSGTFVVKDANNVALGNFISYSDPIDATFSDTIMVVNTTNTTYFGIRANGTLTSAPSPTYELYQGVNCPVNETPAIVWTGKSPIFPASASTPLSFAIGNRSYIYPLATDVPSTLNRLSYRKDGGACVNTSPTAPIRSTLGGVPGIDPQDTPGVEPFFYSMVSDASGRLYVAMGEIGYMSTMRLASCLPSAVDPGCTVANSWVGGTTNAKGFSSPVLVVGKDGTLYASGMDYEHWDNNSEYHTAFSMCKPSSFNSYCTDSNAWTLVNNTSHNGMTPGTLTPSASNGGTNGMIIDANDRIYLVYTAGGGGMLLQSCLATAANAFCTDSPDSWSLGTISNHLAARNALVLDGEGRLHLSYVDFPSKTQYYATCLPSSANAYCSSGWSTIQLGPVYDWWGESQNSLAVSMTGKISITFGDANTGGQTYMRTCQNTNGSCASGADASAAGWTSGAVGPAVIHSSQLAIDAYGTTFLSTRSGYAYCLANKNCSGGSTNWTVVPGENGASYSGIKVVNGRVHMVHFFYNTPAMRMSTLVDSGALLPAYDNKRSSKVSPTYAMPLRIE